MTYLLCDSAQPYDMYLQDSASPYLDSIMDLHDTISYWLLLVLGLVSTMGFLLLILYRHNLVSQRNLSHGTIVELV